MSYVSWSNVRNDLIGGLVSAVLAIPLAMAFGMFAFSAMGDAYIVYGVLSGLYAAMLAGFSCVLFGDRGTTTYAPRVTTTFFLGALLAHLVHYQVVQHDNPRLTIIAFFAIILLGGAFQALFGMVRLGTLIRFTPHPVMAGLQNAAAILIFLVQLGNVCGFDHNVPFTAVADHAAEIKPLSLAVAAVTFVAMWRAREIMPSIPPLVVSLGIGCVLYYVLVLAGLGDYLGPVIGLPDESISPAPLKNLLEMGDLSKLVPLWPLITGGAVALAFVGALDGLLCAKLITPPGTPKIDGDRLLVRLGLANVVSPFFGGITSGINIGATLANRAFGGRTALSVLINSLALLIVILVFFPVLAQTPRVVLSAAIMVVAIQHIDPWSIDLVRRIARRASRHRLMMLIDLGVVVLVAVLSVSINIVLAVFLGIVIAIALFVVRMSRSNIRRTYRGDTVRSRKARAPQEQAVLDRAGKSILVLELQGALFFGSAETLSQHIDAQGDARTIILDLRRVTEIDATGTQTLAEIATGLSRRGGHLALAVRAGGDIAARLHEAGTMETLGEARIFEDVDRAIEWAEDDLLRDALPAESGEIELTHLDLLRELSAEEAGVLAGYLRRVEFSRGTEIFHEGDPGKELFIIVKGRASAYLKAPERGAIRLATFAPTTVFGELAILDAGPRSATITADEDVVCHVLSERAFAALVKDSPKVAVKLLAGLGRELSARLRRANRTIQQLES